ncbi:hypothetical protein R1flu_028009 [Riccia fluitans]|uniref:Uncharacterized protein n=1 Tax=Riccia fluitans TaxID=41844 RepID=A0ABD1XNA3_9MARC
MEAGENFVPAGAEKCKLSGMHQAKQGATNGGVEAPIQCRLPAPVSVPFMVKPWIEQGFVNWRVSDFGAIDFDSNFALGCFPCVRASTRQLRLRRSRVRSTLAHEESSSKDLPHPQIGSGSRESSSSLRNFLQWSQLQIMLFVVSDYGIDSEGSRKARQGASNCL